MINNINRTLPKKTNSILLKIVNRINKILLSKINSKILQCHSNNNFKNSRAPKILIHKSLLIICNNKFPILTTKYILNKIRISKIIKITTINLPTLIITIKNKMYKQNKVIKRIAITVFMMNLVTLYTREEKKVIKV